MFLSHFWLFFKKKRISLCSSVELIYPAQAELELITIFLSQPLKNQGYGHKPHLQANIEFKEPASIVLFLCVYEILIPPSSNLAICTITLQVSNVQINLNISGSSYSRFIFLFFINTTLKKPGVLFKYIIVYLPKHWTQDANQTAPGYYIKL